MRRLIVIMLFILLSYVLHAQSGLSPIWESQLELMTEQNEDVDISELADLLSRLHQSPVNINDSVERSELFFLTPDQQAALAYYIKDYGQLLSLNELLVINGFDSLTVALLQPIAVAHKIYGHEPLTLHNILSHGTSSLIMGASRTLEESRGYRDSIYEGDPMRLYFKYTFDYRHRIRLQLSGDKDPGEAFFSGSQRQGFDFYGGFLSLSEMGRIKKLILGQYRLHFGQGITLWTGFQPWNSSSLTGMRSADGISEASPFLEYGYLQGAAATIRLSRHLDLTSFYSLVDRDATNADSTSVQSLSNSGYHRTATEIAKQQGITEQLTGFNLQYNSNRLRIGAVMQYLWFDKAVQPYSYVYNHYAFTGTHNADIGLHAAYLLSNTTIFGEFSHNVGSGNAGIIGSHIPLGSGNHLSLYYRNYSPDYHNLHSSAYGQNSSTSNEEGVCVALKSRLPWGIVSQLSADYFRFPWLKYQVYAPSHGKGYYVSLSKNLLDSLDITLSYRYKDYGRNCSIDSIHSYLVEQVTRQRLQCRIVFHQGPFMSKSDVALSCFSCEYHSSERGILLGQSLSYSMRRLPLKIEGRLAYFNVSDYDAAIYSLESDLLYEYGTTMFDGKGFHCYLLARCSLGERLSLTARYSYTGYADVSSIGSGYGQIDGSHRQTVKLQLRWNF